MEEDHGNLKKQLSEKDDMMKDLEGSRDNMESNLDNLFADLVKLSNMYEVQETKAEDLRSRNDTLTREVQDERRRKEARRKETRPDDRRREERRREARKAAERRRQHMEREKARGHERRG